jgi:uncharacterized membrane protein
MRKALKVPLIAGGLIAGAGLAYAAKSLIREDEVARDVHYETSLTINKSPAELYSFWREFKNLPLFMKNLVAVVTLDDLKSHWIAKGPNNTTIEWDAEIYNDIEGELIAWRSLENADVVNAGTVRFEAAPADRGTILRVTINYNLPLGVIGKTVSQILGADPAQLIDEDLRRFKQLMETGEIATIDGQTSGRAEGAEPIVSAAARVAGA